MRCGFIPICLVGALQALTACGAADPTRLAAPKGQKQGLIADSSVYSFEGGLQGWSNNVYPNSCTACTVTWVGTASGADQLGPTYLGSGAIKYHLVQNNAQTTYQVHVENPGSVNGGEFIGFSIFVPTASQSGIKGLHVYYNDQNTYLDYYVGGSDLPTDQWVRAYVQAASTVTNPLTGIGVGLDLYSGFVGDIYIDSVDFPL